MTEKEARAAAYWDFLGVSAPKELSRGGSDDPDAGGSVRKGLYYSVEWSGGESPVGRRRRPVVQAIFLDTRWYRDDHCIPSVAMLIPKLGAGIACVTRWITAVLWLDEATTASDVEKPDTKWWSWMWRNPCAKHHATASMLGETQWNWLEGQLRDSTADLIVLVSSIQVLTTNPVMESWCHYPSERRRLLQLVAQLSNLGKAVVILSGDVHHAEILDPAASVPSRRERLRNLTQTGPDALSSFLEVTSSGMTHSCDEPFYGFLCVPLLESFHSHRYQGPDEELNETGGPQSAPYYYIGYNYGTIDIDWERRRYTVNIHNSSGHTVLSTGYRPLSKPVDFSESGRVSWTPTEVDQIVSCASSKSSDSDATAHSRLRLVVAVFLTCLAVVATSWFRRR
jgi:alkaline phosphatase D